MSNQISDMLCSKEEVPDLIKKGWKSADLHLHTWCSNDVAPIAETDPLHIYHTAREAGFSYITFTDHDTMDAYDRVGWTRPGIVPGVEIRLLDPANVGHTLHINVFQLNLKQFNDLEHISQKAQNIELFLEYLNENRLFYSYNHPFWHEPNEKPCIYSIFNVAKHFPVVEYNMGRTNSLNLHALSLAESNHSGLVATSDSHAGWSGKAMTLAKGDNFNEYFRNIVTGHSKILPYDLTINRLSREIIKRIRFIFGKSKWIFEKPSFAIETGIDILDSWTTSLVQSDSNRIVYLKKLLQFSFETITKSQIPSALYIRSQNKLAEEVSLINQALHGQNGTPSSPNARRQLPMNLTGQGA